ncbi:MAG: TIGR02996 domain-containing protein [Gemmataceae bacterium]
MDDRVLLAAVLADPDDDLPRLAYADWLEETGNEARAEFIRAQIELAHLPLADDRHAALLARCRMLQRCFGAEWLGEVPPSLVVDQFERGFPVRVGLRPRRLPERVLKGPDFAALDRVMHLFPLHTFRAELIGAVVPTMIRFPTATHYPGRGDSPLERLARWEPLRRFSTLDFGRDGIVTGQGDFEPGIEALAASPHVHQVAALRLSGLLLGENAVRLIAESPHLSCLRAVDLRHNVPLIDHQGVLLETNLAERLEVIDGIDLVTAGRWLHRPGCRLRELGITIDPYRDHPETTDAAFLVGAPGLAGLRRLTLHFEGPAAWQERPPERDEVLRVEHLMELLACPALGQLEELNLCGVGLHDGEITALPQLPSLRNLVTLRLRRCLLNGALVAYLRAFLIHGRLRRLDLSCNGLNNAGARMLASWPELARLHELCLDANDIGPPGFEAITRSPNRNAWLHLTGELPPAGEALLGV